MINSLTQKILQEQMIGNPGLFLDVDGPGVGNSAIVGSIERPESGGIIVNLSRYKYPYKGNPIISSVERIGIVKKNIMFFREAIISNKISMIFLGILLMIPGISGMILKFWTDYFYKIAEWLMYWELLEPTRYCKCVRELYRVFTIILEREKNKTIKKMIELVRDFFCMVIEQDSAYRFRFQDVIAKARKIELIAGGLRQIREINRLFGILLSREQDKEHISARWKSIRNILIVLLIAQPRLRRKLAEFFIEINLSEIKPDQADDYFNSLRKDYNFKGKTLLKRVKDREAIEGDNWVNFEEVAREMLKQAKEQYADRGGQIA